MSKLANMSVGIVGDVGLVSNSGRGVLVGRAVGLGNSETTVGVSVTAVGVGLSVIPSNARGENLKYIPIPNEITKIATKINKYLFEDFISQIYIVE